MLGHLDEGAGHMFRLIPQADAPIPEMKLWGGIDYYEEYTRAEFPGERMWPKEIWERGEKDSEFKKAMTAADNKWMGNRCQKNIFWSLQKIMDENKVDYMCVLPLCAANSFVDYWAIMVANAAPETPILSPIMNQRSRTIFSTAEIAKKTRGTTEFPIRKVRISYKRINDRTFSSKVTKVIKKKDADRFSISNLSFLCSKRMENKAALPVHKPSMMEVRKVMSVKEEPTAASAFRPRNCPTIKVSTML